MKFLYFSFKFHWNILMPSSAWEARQHDAEEIGSTIKWINQQTNQQTWIWIQKLDVRSWIKLIDAFDPKFILCDWDNYAILLGGYHETMPGGDIISST